MGRGLGLAAVQGIVRSSGGAIEVRTAKMQGSRFSVYIPAATGGAAEVETPVPARVKRGTGISILVIDDEEPVRETLRLMLERAGHEVRLAEDGPAGLGILEAAPAAVGLVLLDIGIPGMSGPETLRRMREMGITVPVIVITGYGERDALQSLPGGRYPILYKPFRPEALLRAVEAVAGGQAAGSTG
jgi:CheY-like chemotaxis protein